MAQLISPETKERRERYAVMLREYDLLKAVVAGCAHRPDVPAEKLRFYQEAVERIGNELLVEATELGFVLVQ
ncbi:MAG TPA: hypothetical protein VNG29_00885 [Candidatus Paceibacterota bacterium]|nr:hypothetical protein [Candidatus Paceibacterota bacterium]